MIIVTKITVPIKKGCTHMHSMWESLSSTTCHDLESWWIVCFECVYSILSLSLVNLSWQVRVTCMYHLLQFHWLWWPAGVVAMSILPIRIACSAWHSFLCSGNKQGIMYIAYVHCHRCFLRNVQDKWSFFYMLFVKVSYSTLLFLIHLRRIGQ